MTLYLREFTSTGRSRPTTQYLALTAIEGTPDPRSIVARWPYDGTEERRQAVLRFIERWAAQSGITIGNPELWSLPAPRKG